jgi:hypothetical protein
VTKALEELSTPGAQCPPIDEASSMRTCIARCDASTIESNPCSEVPLHHDPLDDVVCWIGDRPSSSCAFGRRRPRLSFSHDAPGSENAFAGTATVVAPDPLELAFAGGPRVTIHATEVTLPAPR